MNNGRLPSTGQIYPPNYAVDHVRFVLVCRIFGCFSNSRCVSYSMSNLMMANKFGAF